MLGGWPLIDSGLYCRGYGSLLVCVKSEKNTSMVTLRPLGSIRQGEAKIHALQYWGRQGPAYI